MHPDSSHGAQAQHAEVFLQHVKWFLQWLRDPSRSDKENLVERSKTGAPLAEIDWTTVYASGPKGYSTYPALQPANL
jgi:hypothetical protein